MEIVVGIRFILILNFFSNLCLYPIELKIDSYNICTWNDSSQLENGLEIKGNAYVQVKWVINIFPEVGWVIIKGKDTSQQDCILERDSWINEGRDTFFIFFSGGTIFHDGEI